MHTSILVVLNDTPCSKVAVNFLTQCPLSFAEVHITLMYVLRKPTGSEEMMGKKFIRSQEEKIEAAISAARHMLIEAGYLPDHIQTHIETQPYATVADGIIAEVHKGDHDIVVIGRKKMSKSEEFVLGDASIKVIRDIDRATVIVVRC